jgi:fibronectin-binding autotransporter adhesin
MKPTRILGRSIASLLALIPLTAQTAQDSITAVGAQNATAPSSTWATPANWSLNAIPTVNDNAVIVGAGAVDIRGSGFAAAVPPFFTEIQDLTFNATAATTLANNSTSQDMTLALNGGRGTAVPLISTIGNFAYTIQSPGNVATGTAHILTLQLKKSGAIDVAGTGSLTIGSAITQSGGTFGLTKTGTGTLILSNANTFGANVNVNAGILQISNSGGAGLGSIVVNGASLALQNLTITNAVVFNGGTILTRTGDNSMFAGLVSISGTTTAILRSYTTPANDLNITVSGALSGASHLTIDGNATNATSGKAFILTNPANTFSGTFHVNAGQRLRSAPAASGKTLGAGAVDLNGGILQLRDNGAGDNGVLAYGNNVTVLTGDGAIDVDRVSANSGNTFALGSLTIGARTLNVTGANGYAVRFGATTLTGAATFNTDTAAAILSGPVAGAFSLTKTGAGNLVIPATNTYSGPTNIDAGRLVLTGSIASSPRVDIKAGGTFDVTGVGGGFTLSGTQTLSGAGTVAGSVTVASGGRIEAGDSIGAGTLRIDNLTFGSAAGQTATLRVAPNETALAVNVLSANGLVANGGASSVTVNIAGMAPSVGTHVLVDYDGAIGGTGFSAFALGTLPPRTIATLQNNGANTSIDLNVTGVDFPVWKGALSSEWSTATLAAPKNWVLNSNNNSTTDFLPNDSVIFNDVATGTTINVSVADVAPFAVNFSNNTKNFTITGSKAITGTASFIKNGSGVVTISNTNSFTGAVMLNQGAVRVAAVANSGVNSPLGAGNSLFFDGGALEFTGATGNTNRAITLNDGGGTFNTATTLTLTGVISGTGLLTKTGSGTVVLTGANTYGDTVISGGLLQLGNGGTTGTLGTGIVINDGTLAFDRSDAALVVTNEIDGAGGLVKNGTGSVTLGGASSNTYAGVTAVNAGVLIAGKPAGSTAISGDLVIAAGAAFRYAGNNVSDQIADTSSITINGGTFGDPTSTAPTNPGATDTVANLTINGGSFGSGRNDTIVPFTITGLLHVTAGKALAQRGGSITAEAVQISGGSIDLDGGSTTLANESRLNVGAGGLILTGTSINFNTGPSALAANSVGSIVLLNGDVTASGNSAFVRVSAVVPKALVDLGGDVRTFDIINGTTTIAPDIENGGILKTGAGVLNLNGAQNYESLEATGGTTNVNNPLGTGSSTLTTTATVNLATSNTLAAVDIGAGGAVHLGAAAPAPQPADDSAANDLAGGAVVAVPEPGTLGLLLFGALGVFSRRRRDPV